MAKFSRYPSLKEVSRMKKDPNTRVPPWAMPKVSQDLNPADDISNSIRGTRGWLGPREVRDPERQKELARSRRPARRM